MSDPLASGQTQTRRLRASAARIASAVAAFLALVGAGSAIGQVPTETPQVPQTQLPAPPPTPAPETPSGLARWFNPATAPFIPIPEIAVDPDSGTTVGLIPTWIKTDENHQIRQIIAPDVLHNPYFGYGMHARMYSYTSKDEQWVVIGGIKERVERGLNARYEKGRLREGNWSFNANLVYDRDGTPRFYGIGNDTPENAETNFTNQQELAQLQVGFNLTHAWQLQYTVRKRVVDVLRGTLSGVRSIEDRFPGVRGVGISKELLNRFAIVYDTRDDLTVPSRGIKWTVYGGLASRGGVLNDSLYSEAGVDGRGFWPIGPTTVFAAHAALRYLPTAHNLPFWALSTLGGGLSEVGGQQPLRGYGAGRFYDRNSFSATAEVRQRVLSFDAIATHVELEVTPFVDVGRVFSDSGTWPVGHLHTVGGVGFRGVARPFVVGYVDIGYGSEGTAVFTGINYPF